MNSSNIISCAVCGHTDKLYSCSRCKLIFYCSKEHQKKDWKKHKVDCGKPSENRNTEGNIITNIEEKLSTLDKIKLLNSTSITPPRTPISNQLIEDSPSTSRISITNFGKPTTSLETQLTPPTTPENEEKASSISQVLGTEAHTTSTTSQKGAITLERPESSASISLPQQGSAESEILATAIERLCFYPSNINSTLSNQESAHKQNMPVNRRNVIPGTPEFRQRTDPAFQYSTPMDDMVNIIIEDLNAHGLCVLDDFCGPQIGKAVLQEVLNIYSKGIFQDGQLVSKSKNDAQSIRSDKILWVDGKEPHCRYIGQVLKKIDALIMRANKTPNNGKLGCYNINGRTKAMCAVYPGSGTHYVKHVDNPNHDGRCVTAIYYLNLNWDVKKDGGVLRIYPESEKEKMAEVAPLFDRLIFFWSDRQNPHEVQPAYSTRYAITLWYYDGPERALATKKFELENKVQRTNMTSIS
ncbi:egl nine homolog 1 isoform X2 [Coccinella septempunctata]|uniref:egl nine homolog 1 isoform X2 n=1 Tax=Coccinella septempunctata TaxID=41139 RepID=UPI001D089827|nr:egl nine homolog 1 isoform X2 [Coccinella septempunctata]